ncbi:MAG: PHB depolymerase family esterase [Giesbergeria sp.]|nr:PHB depolymerase family esterase [Giesbergeria sp.]MBP6419410.1 PHB depolymerase family esterase [Giesbergeria sp.]
MDWNTHFTHMLDEATQMMYGGHLMGATEAMQRALMGPLSDVPTHTHVSTEVLDALLPDRNTLTALTGLAGLTGLTGLTGLGSAQDRSADAAASAPETEAPGSFERVTLAHDGAQHHYLLYVPPGAAAGTPMPLVLMLHGCSQDADDFAAATGMNQAAAAANALVLYPAQARNANPGGCWNWFESSNQHRGQGELGLMVAMVRDVMARHSVDAQRVYAAGISAGGAMVALLGREYPEMFAALGVHSGLQAGAADNMMAALSAMNNGAKLGPSSPSARAATHSSSALHPALIVFHGDADTTVSAKNGEQLVDAALQAALGDKGAAVQETQSGQSAAGQRFTRHLYRAKASAPVLVEYWVLHNAGHAWSGGSAKVSQTDPRGVNATQEMLRFFLEHPRSAVPTNPSSS